MSSLGLEKWTRDFLRNLTGNWEMSIQILQFDLSVFVENKDNDFYLSMFLKTLT